MWQNKGQGIMEGVFAIGIIGLIMSGVAVLILMTLSSNKNSFDRRKATELGTVVMEELISQAQNDTENFWKLNSSANNTRSGYGGYVYDIGMTNITINGCGVGKTDCAEVVIEVGFSGRSPQSIYLNRFFSKQ
jgi:Tfp pilus assembly protein PilV